MNKLRTKLRDEKIKVLFTDYYDTLVHRNVHPNSVLRIWSKIVIRELGLNISIDTLYFTFKESVLYLVKKLNTDRNELPYEALQMEVFRRLNSSYLITDDLESAYLDIFEKAHLKAELGVQRLNKDTLNIIKDFKDRGGKVYLLSDFYCPKSLFENLLKHHEISHLFDGIYSSSSEGKSKHRGSIYQSILTNLKLDPQNVLMIGDNYRSDFKNAINAGINAYLLPHKKYNRRAKINGIGSDKAILKKVIKETFSRCNDKSMLPYTEYSIFYHFFVERLYIICKKQNIQSLFFLSREGLFLKRLFDSYLNDHEINEGNSIRTHYLKVSRQASLQITLDEIQTENFSYLRRRYQEMSLDELFNFFNFNKNDQYIILNQMNVDGTVMIKDFFSSKVFNDLKENEHFKQCYNEHRLTNKKVFKEYLNSFGEDIENKGMCVVDIGWGGTMQEAIYKFFDRKIQVTGFYLGLNAIYNIMNDTKRYGINFSVLPFENYNSHILRANAQLYEQLASAGHGGCVEYSSNNGSYTIEYHQPKEKWLFDNYIKDHQEQMFQIHQSLMKNLKTVCYDDSVINNELIVIALKSGIFQNSRKIKFLETLNLGYYQNISNKKIGIDYEIPKQLVSVKSLFKFILKPEEFFRYLVKLKPKLYSTNKVLYVFFPSLLVYWFYQFNRLLRFKLLRNVSLLKFNYFK